MPGAWLSFSLIRQTTSSPVPLPQGHPPRVVAPASRRSPTPSRWMGRPPPLLDERTSPLTASTRLTAAEQREFSSRMERKQMKEFMGVSRSLSSVCVPGVRSWPVCTIACQKADAIKCAIQQAHTSSATSTMLTHICPLDVLQPRQPLLRLLH